MENYIGWILKSIIELDDWVKVMNPTGFLHLLNSFSMRFSNERIVIKFYDQILEKIYFKQYKIDDAYKMALCSLNPKMPEDVFIYTVNDLINMFVTTRIVS